MDEIAFCPKCAWIGDLDDDCRDEPDYGICCECGTQLIGTGIPQEDDPLVCTTEFYKLRRKIYNEMIEPMRLLDKDYPAYKTYYNTWFEIEEKRSTKKEIMKSRRAFVRNNNPNIAKCPTCGSTKLQKISAGNKVGSAALFGVFAIGHVNKTYKCLNCGYKW